MKAAQSMSSSALAFMPQQEALQIAEVQHTNEHGFQVCIQNERFNATLAASCILRPNIGDKVLIVALPESTAYILAVLEQASAEQTFQFSKHLTIHTDENASIITAEHLELQAEQHLSLTSPELSLYAAKGKAEITQWHYKGDFLQQSVRHISTQAHLVETVTESTHLQAERSFSQIADLQHEMIGRVRTLVQQDYRLDCEYADIFAEQDVKIDAEQIHLG